MRARSLTTTLALAFAGTTLAVFGLVGSLLYFALERQVQTQDDLDIVLAVRHTRRLAQELSNAADVREHAERLESQVLGNTALSLQVLDPAGRVLVEHNVPSASERQLPAVRANASAQITTSFIVASTTIDDKPQRSLAADARLGDGSDVTILVTRNMLDRWMLLDQYRDRLNLAGIAGVLIAFLMSYLLVRESLKPLRELARGADNFTVDKLHTRIAVEHAPSELQALIQSLNAMFAGLEQSFQRLSQFTADLAHDMRTPLGNLRGSTEVALARPRTSEEYQTLLASNLEECDRLSRMIENVLFLARAEHPQFVRHTREFDVADELMRMAEYFEGLAEDAGVSIHVKGTGRLKADVELFRRAVSNLLANAVRYTTRGGAITLSVSEHCDTLDVCVANEGEPLDPDSLERLFDRFYRGDPSRTSSTPASGSAGLGLAIVRTIMELHGGTARAASVSGVANVANVANVASITQFILTFPRRTAD